MYNNEKQPLLGSNSTGRCSSPEPHSKIMGRPEMEDSDADFMYKSDAGSDLDSRKAPTETKKGKLTRRKLLVVAAILSTELCERLTYYSVAANLVLFCQDKLDYDDDTASSISMIFSGCVYIIPVFGGYIADAMAGKFNTIFGSGLLYLLGLVLLPASAVDFRYWFGQDDNGDYYDLSLDARRAYFLLGLGFVAVGTGGIKANVGPFGAQQVHDLGPDAVQSFFNWFYWFINAGAFVAYLAVAYVQQNIGFDYGFLIPLLSMLVALVIFYVARKFYLISPPGGSVLAEAIGLCVYGVKRGGGCSNCFNHTRQSTGGKYTDKYVDGIKSIVKTLPIFGCFIMYWAIYFQMTTTFFLQSERMNITVGDVKLPAAMLNIFNTIIIMLLIPLVDRLIYPCLVKLGKPLSHLHRIGIGFIFAAAAMAIAGVVEIYRKENLSETGGVIQELGSKTFNASDMTMFVQIPQFACIGASEVFASISGLEFAYSQAPEELQGLLMGIFLTTSGLGAYVSTAILKITVAASSGDQWLPDDINKGHADYFFFMLVGLMAVNFVVFVILAKYIYMNKRSNTKPVSYYDNKAVDMPSVDESKKEPDADFLTKL